MHSFIDVLIVLAETCNLYRDSKHLFSSVTLYQYMVILVEHYSIQYFHLVAFKIMNPSGCTWTAVCPPSLCEDH